MGHNPSRNPFKLARQGVATQAVVDEYKARSIWAAWRAMKAEVRARYFNGEEIGWMDRYGSRLDQLSSLTVDHRNEREKHFVAVCLGHEAPKNDRERLWLRARMVVRYEGSLKRAAACGEAIRRLQESEAARAQLEEDLQQEQMDGGSAWAIAQVDFGMQLQHAIERHRGICNVQWATWLFYGPEVFGPAPRRVVMTEKNRGVPVGWLTPSGLKSQPC